MNSLVKHIIVLSVLALVAGCGGGNAFTQSSGSSSSGSGGSSGGSSVSGSVTLALTDGSGAATNSVSVDSPGTVKATVVDAKGSPISGAVVTFTSKLATFNPTAGSALTNSSGVATVTLLAGATTGADTVSASVTVGGTTASSSLGYAINAPSVSLSALTIGTSPLSANGTTSLTVSVLDGKGLPYTTPVDVTFSSICSSSSTPKATISSPITTTNGVAISNYQDKGCANTDTVTASLTLGGTTVSASANLVVNPAAAGSIQFVSASPTNITLKGTGGAGKQETSTITFKVVDAAGNPKSSAAVNFTLSTAVGGISLVPSTATTDTNGQVATVVSSGSVATAVRVIATVAGTSLQTQSDQLTITTGVPAQDHFSLAASTHSIEGWDYDGVTSTLSVILSDHFSNPVPDGTAVNFIAEGAQVGGACTTTGGGCSVTFTSANLRPDNGRVTVLAYGIGEEGFTDMDGDGYVSSNAERVDANGVSTDMPEAWVDYNENGVYDVGEPFIDFNGNHVYDGPDGLYNGILCKSGSPWCSPIKNINVRDQQVIVLSGSTAFLKVVGTNPGGRYDANTNTLALDVCNTGSQFNNVPVTASLQITDLHGNTMPAGTTISATTTNGKILVAPASPIPDSTACVHGDPSYPNCPADAPALGDYGIVMTSDATQSVNSSSPPPYTCSNTSASGILTVTVSTPKGLKTSFLINVTD